MAKLQEKQKLLISIAVFTVLVLALAGGVVYFNISVCKELDRQIDEVKAAVAKLDDKIQQIPDLAVKRDEMAQNDKEYALEMPTNQEASIEKFFEGSIFEFGEETGVRILNATPAQPTTAAPVAGIPGGIPNADKVTYQLTIKSGFFAFGRFMSLLESHKRFIRIDSFSISGGTPSPTSSPTEGEAIYDITLQVSTYVFKAQ